MRTLIEMNDGVATVKGNVDRQPANQHPPDVMSALSPAQRLVTDRLQRAFHDGGEALYLVGGIVRDALLNRPLPNDLDFATSATPGRTHPLGLAAGASSAYLIGERFGTVGFVFRDDGDEIQVEVTTYRQETYPDQTRFPEVRLGGSLTDDLARRDFTINAIAVNPGTGDLIDPWLGRADLAQAVIRAVGDPDVRFLEDPLRLLRAARFVAQLSFGVAAETKSAMRRQADSLRRISRERVYIEMTKLLLGDYAPDGLEVLGETGLLAVAMPQLADLAAEALQAPSGRQYREKDLWRHTLAVVSQVPAQPVVRWAALLHDAAKPRTRRVDATGEVSFLGHERLGAELARDLLRDLHADRQLTTAVSRVVELHGRPATYDEAWTDSAVRRLALDAGAQWEDLLVLAAADVTSGREHRRQLAVDRIQRLRAHLQRLEADAALDRLQSPLDGTDLMTIFDRGPGIWIKRIKDQLRELVIDGELRPDDRKRAIGIARQLLRDIDNGGPESRQG